MLRSGPRLSQLRRFATAAKSAREPSSEGTFPTVRMQTKLFINNQFVDSVTGKTFQTYNPGNGEVLANVAQAGKEDVDLAVKAATNAFYKGKWSTMAPRERGECLTRLAGLLDKQVDDLAKLEALNNGKTYNQSKVVDGPACPAILRYYAGWADKIQGRTIPIGNDFQCSTYHEPVGVCGLIIPWNLPLIGVAAKLGPALTTGNTVVLKSAEQTPLTALRVAECIEEAGFPPGVVNIISGDGPSTGEHLINHPGVDKISFTGSTAVGKHILATASRAVKRVTLELGGNNPVIVCKDADVDLAVQTVHNGLFWNDAEACAAASRIFVHDSIYDEFVAKSVKLAEARQVGHPFDPNSQSGSQVSKRQFEKIMGYIQSAKDEGANLVAGGNRIGTKGYYIEPTVFRDVKDDMKVFKEEVFGPVLTLNRFSDLDDVIVRANASPYGLAAGVFTKDIATGTKLQRKIRAGMVFWNCYHVVDVSAPFGGFKQSGFGREGGDYGLTPYMEVKMAVQKCT